MGSSSTNIPAPDPRLIEAQVKSMGVQDQALASMLEISKQQADANASLLPIQKESLQFGLDASKKAYEQSQSDRGWLLGRREALTGMQDKMVDEANTFNSEAEGTRRAQAAQADVTKMAGDAQAAEDAALASMGIAPGSGRAMALRGARGVDIARASVAAANAERMAARNEGRMLTDRAVNSLAGYPAAASGQTGAGAAYGAGVVNTANAGAGGINAGYGAMTGAQQAASGVAGGMGANAAGMYGVQSNAYLNAQNSKNELFGTGIGAAATLGAAFI